MPAQRHLIHTFRLLLLPLLLPLALSTWLAGCAKDGADPTKDWSAERFYTEAKKALDNSNYAAAIKHFETLEARYPYGPYAEQAQLDIAYAYYKSDDAVSAIAAAERFIRLHPTHPNVDYAYYIKGLAHVNDQSIFLSRLFDKSGLSDRDPKAAQEGFATFREVVTRFPQSRYAADAGYRMQQLLDILSKNEIHVAEYYLSREAYVAAVNRCKYVIEHYQRTTAIEDALGIQALAYQKMGLSQLRDDTLRVLQQNFPSSRYLKEIKGVNVGRQ